MNITSNRLMKRQLNEWLNLWHTRRVCIVIIRNVIKHQNRDIGPRLDVRVIEGPGLLGFNQWMNVSDKHASRASKIWYMACNGMCSNVSQKWCALATWSTPTLSYELQINTNHLLTVIDSTSYRSLNATPGFGWILGFITSVMTLQTVVLFLTKKSDTPETPGDTPLQRAWG